MRGLGGLTINVVNSTASGEQLYGNASSFSAEQRLGNGSLWTLRQGKDDSSLETQTWVHPEQNLLLTALTYLGPGGSVNSGTPIELELQLWALGKTSHVRSSAMSTCTLSADKTTSSCSRRYGAPNVTGFVSPWTALGNRGKFTSHPCTFAYDACQ